MEDSACSGKLSTFGKGSETSLMLWVSFGGILGILLKFLGVDIYEILWPFSAKILDK